MVLDKAKLNIITHFSRSTKSFNQISLGTLRKQGEVAKTSFLISAEVMLLDLEEGQRIISLSALIKNVG